MLFIVIVLLVFITQSLFYHFWLVALDSFIASVLLGKSFRHSFWSSFLASFLVWFGQVYFIDSQNGSLLSTKMANLFGLGRSEWIILITILIGAFTGALGGVVGFSLRNIFLLKKKK
jgi:hypothetical protein